MARILTDRSPEERLQLIGDFFLKKDDVHLTLDRVVGRLQEANIPHAVIGGMALGLHGFARVTGDVDILTTPDGLDAIHKNIVGLGYVPRFPGARKQLKDTQTGIPIDLITSGEYPGDGKPKAVRFPDPMTHSIDIGGKRVLRLETIIELKLASGLTNPNRLNDLGDVQRLIEHLHLPLDLAEKLDPSVRDTYVQYWHFNQNATGPDRE